ncbi:PA2778 family cysteine peptidase [Halomonas sp. Bachu 37]|uniref:PA2778 family cysteine peptidase n=1 Tax=Halomonas kashgarensis TaxID=3084920 RepID=UPI00321728CE
MSRLYYARSAGVLLILALLTGCATAVHLQDTTLRSLPQQVLLVDVPFHAQSEYQCGPASLAMVLNHRDIDTTVEELIPQVFLPGRDGSLQPEMLATTRRHAKVAFPIDASMDALLKEVAAGHPVVVMQNLALPAWPMWHYAVAIGYDLQKQEIILHSGENREHSMAFSRFDATWARSDRWGFIVLPPGELPSDTAPYRAMDAISSFEEVQGARAALPSWLALSTAYPDFAMGHFARGNALYATNSVSSAQRAFRRAIQEDDSLGAAWLNLGLLQAQQGEHDEALESLHQAAAIPGPWQSRARQTLEASGDFNKSP